MKNENSLIPSQILLDKINNQISLADKYLNESDNEQWIAFFLVNPKFFCLIVSLFYPFSIEELVRYKSKLILGSAERGVDFPVYYGEDYEDEDDYEPEEYHHDENSFEYNYGLIFNTNINWDDDEILNLFGFSSSTLTFESEWEGDIELQLPITIEQMKDIEKAWHDNNFMVEYNDVNRDEEETIHFYLQEHGLRGYSTNGYTGEIIDPPGLAKLLKETTYIAREKISAQVQQKYDEIDAEYAETITEVVQLNDFKDLLQKDGLFFLKNPKIWELTLKDKLDKGNIEFIFNKI